MKLSSSIGIRLLLFCLFFGISAMLMMEDIMYGEEARRLMRERAPLVQKTLPPESAAAIRARMAEKPWAFLDDWGEIVRLLLRSSGYDSNVGGVLRLYAEPLRTGNARLNFVAANLCSGYEVFGNTIFVSENRDMAVFFYPVPEQAPTTLSGVQVMTVFESVDGSLRCSDWYAYREENHEEAK